MPRPWHTHAAALLAYAAVAIVFSWPLPLHLQSALTGGTGGDTGVYVWNQWVFSHELIQNGRFPYFTTALFGPNEVTNLSLQNYTTFANLIALPLQPVLGVVGAFNVVFLVLMVLGGYAAFLLAHHVTRDAAASWIAGLLFGWSPILVTRGTGHFSLIATAPLAIFILLLLRADGHVRVRDAIALGATIAWASMTDAYFAIFCLLLGAAFIVSRVASLELRQRPPVLTRMLNAGIIALAMLIAGIAITGGWQMTIAGRALSVRSLYTPVLLLTVLTVARLALRWRVRVADLTVHDVWRFVRLTATTGVVTAILAAPLLYAAAVRIADGNFVTPTIFWRSSPQGIDVLALFLPNPNHALAPEGLARWLSQRPQAYIENVASLSFVALAIMFFAWRGGWRPSRWWLGVCGLFGLLALGPFVHVAGVNTYVPGPWAILRYVPIVGLVHTPARFAILFTLCFAVLAADALRALIRRYPERRQTLLAAAGVLLVAELLPIPMTLYPADIPPLYRHVAAAPPSTVLLEIPTGVADGVSSLGSFSARTEFNQTAHGKTVIGGFLSRISRRRVDDVLMNPVHRALAMLSEKRTLTAGEEEMLVKDGPIFIRDKQIGFVVVDRTRTSPAFEALVVKAFRLRHVETNDAFVLYSTDAAVSATRARAQTFR
jgi:hypothetical protein